MGTLDQLVGLSDDLAKLDTYVESVTRKMASYLGEVLEDQRDKLAENLLANQSKGWVFVLDFVESCICVGIIMFIFYCWLIDIYS